MVMDALVMKITDGAMSYDDGGKLAASGTVIPELLEWMLKDPYLDRQPPKTTGREYYGAEYVEKLISFGDYPLVDILTTATAFTARSIALSLRRFADRIPRRLVVGGGGSRNPTLLRFLQEAMPKNPEKAEFFLPFAVADLLAEGKARAKVLRSADKWYGVTYAADKPQVVAALKAMAAEGKYPDGLWG
jgi:1,6-anhydro-N-acetylmuramate kinase